MPTLAHFPCYRLLLHLETHWSQHLSANYPSQILKRPIKRVHDFNISSLQLSRSRLWRFRASSGKYALLYGLSLSVISLPGSFLLPFLWSNRACALLLSSASLCKRSARNLSMELEKTDLLYLSVRIFTTSSHLIHIMTFTNNMWLEGTKSHRNN